MTAATANKVNQHIGKLMVPIMAIYALGASQGGINAGIATMGAAFRRPEQTLPMWFRLSPSA